MEMVQHEQRRKIGGASELGVERGFAKKEKIWGTTDAETKPLHIVRVRSIRAYLPFTANGCFIFREMRNALC